MAKAYYSTKAPSSITRLKPSGRSYAPSITTIGPVMDKTIIEDGRGANQVGSVDRERIIDYFERRGLAVWPSTLRVFMDSPERLGVLSREPRSSAV